MALFTGKGDDGTTYFFGSARRYSKDSPLAWALGTLDETNSFLGLCKVLAREEGIKVPYKEVLVAEIVEKVQQSLFIIQAELAGSEDKTITEGKIKTMEDIINAIENELPPIKTFLVSGSTSLQAHFDYARTVARRAERSVVALPEELQPKEFSKKYLNRLSSLLYAIARLSAHRSGIKEDAPTYR